MSNEIVPISYETALGQVTLTPDDVKKYLVRGRAEYVEDGELVMFMASCKAQKLNPFVTGEVHLIKYSKDDPAQIVIGYDTYKRRAEDNPNFICKESGIVVQRGADIIQKEGACLYPTEKLIGGWCRVHKIRHEKEVLTYKEVSFEEYNKGKSLWKSLPCTMIEKVAVSQALRDAFPKDYEGVYTSEEMPYYEPREDNDPEPVVVDVEITQQERKELFKKAKEVFGEACNDKVKEFLADEGLESTSGMKFSVFKRIMEKIEVYEQQDNTEA